MSGSLLVDVLSNSNNMNDNNTTAPSSSLYAVTVTFALPWVQSVYCYQYCMPGATNYVLSDENDTDDQRDQCVVDFLLLLYH